MTINIEQLRAGLVAKIKLSDFSRLAGISLPTAYRKIKAKIIMAQTDPMTGRIYVPTESALEYLNSLPRYEHQFQNSKAIVKMEIARNAKAAKQALLTGL